MKNGSHTSQNLTMYNNTTDGSIGFQKGLKLGKRYRNVEARRIGIAESSHKNGIYSVMEFVNP